MTHVTCRLTAKNWDQLRNLMLGKWVWATFTFYTAEDSVKPELVILRLQSITNHWQVSSIRLYCRPTNYELLRWLVEMPSRDFEHYRMSGGSLTCYRIFITCQTTSWHVEKCQEFVWHVINILHCFCLRFFCDVFCFFSHYRKYFY